MTMFNDTMKEAIRVYKQMLRKHLPQVKRIIKLNQLNLRKVSLADEKTLYLAGYAIIEDIEKNFSRQAGYYSYSGIENFAKYLQDFLAEYVLEGEEVIHKLQKASSALVKAVQVLGAAQDHIPEEAVEELSECVEVIRKFGSDSHKDTLQSTLKQASSKGGMAYSLLRNLQIQGLSAQSIHEI